MNRSSAILLLMISTVFAACNQEPAKPTTPSANETATGKAQIAAMLDSFNVAAAQADYNRYFGFYTEDATFNGTDATENWNKPAFMAWAKPFFDKKTTWSFKALKRNIYFGKYSDMAWFEELLDTQMKICRGSGVVVKQGGSWKLQQYVLSVTVPNSKLDSVITLKTSLEDSLMRTLSGK